MKLRIVLLVTLLATQALSACGFFGVRWQQDHSQIADAEGVDDECSE